MADQNYKRQSDGNDETERTHQKYKKYVTEVEPKSINNIYYDCLEHIFDYLDLASLMNVAGTCKRLQIAAAAKFGDEYDEKGFQVILRSRSFRQEPAICIKQNRIYVQGLKSCLPFMRCFGVKISNLKVINHPPNTYLERYVHEYGNNQQLKILDICGYDLKFNKLLNFINGKSSISRLSVAAPDMCSWPETFKNVSMVDLDRFVAEHQSMIELYLDDYYWFTASSVLYFIRQLKFLRRFECQIRGAAECSRLIKHLNSKWNLKIVRFNDDFIIKLRR